MTGVDLWEPAPGALQRLLSRGADSLRARWGGARAQLGVGTYVPSRAATSGPQFTIDGFVASFEELEAITFHAQVVEAIERVPQSPIAGSQPPPAEPSACAPALRGRPRRRPAKVYDITPMSLEIDLLEMRLLELWDLVDRFVVWEAPRGFGGVGKPLFLQRNLARFERFRDKLVPIVVDAGAPRHSGGHRLPTDFSGEDAMRAAAWRQVRRQVAFEPDAVILSSDLDEFPPRHFVAWLREFDGSLPVRLRVPSLRYSFAWRDTTTHADILAFSSPSLPALDADPHLVRHLPARVLKARGGVHLTSFLPPLALVAKFAMTTDWEPGILPFVRNAHGECEAMMAEGRWFERRLRRYDAVRDPEGLVPWAARAHRARYPRHWAAEPA